MVEDWSVDWWVVGWLVIAGEDRRPNAEGRRQGPKAAGRKRKVGSGRREANMGGKKAVGFIFSKT